MSITRDDMERIVRIVRIEVLKDLSRALDYELPVWSSQDIAGMVVFDHNAAKSFVDLELQRLINEEA